MSALLYACIRGCNVFTLTSDRDFIDIQDNLMIGILENYTFNELLSIRLNTSFLDDKDKNSFNKEGIKLLITYDEVNSEFNRQLKRLSETKEAFSVGILYYKQDVNKVFRDSIKVPLWLRDFILESKNTIDCYSIDHHVESKNKFRFTCDPNKSRKYIHFDVYPRITPFYPGFKEHCFSICKYEIEERDNPASITCFLS